MPNHRKYTEEQLTFIRENSDLGCPEIAIKLNLSVYRVRNLAAQFKISVKSKYDWSKKEIEILKNNLHLSYPELSSLLSRRKDTISKKCNELQLICNKRLPKVCDHNIFSNRTEECCYWAGFIAADGCVNQHDGSKRLVVVLGDKDKLHLEKMQTFLKTDNPIRHRKETDCNSLEVCSEKIFNDLKYFNITERKSLTLEFPTHLTNWEQKHFIRGFCDGDGSLGTYSSKKYKNLQHISFVGTRNFLLHLRIFFNKFNKLSRTQTSEIFNLSYGGLSANDVADKIYKDANIYLERKYSIYTSWALLPIKNRHRVFKTENCKREE